MSTLPTCSDLKRIPSDHHHSSVNKKRLNSSSSDSIFSYDHLLAACTDEQQQQHQLQQRRVVIKKVIKPVSQHQATLVDKSHSILNDLDDLPSESDVSSAFLLLRNHESAGQQQRYKISKQFRCGKCNSELDSENLLREHYESHQSATGAAAFKLTSHRVFNQFDLVTLCQVGEQKKSDRGGDGYECRWCDTRFGDIWSRIGHEREIHPQSSLSESRKSSTSQQHQQQHKCCQICSFEFTRASNLRSHILSVHANQLGKLVFISVKSDDNSKRFKIEFDQDAINAYRENNKIITKKSSHVNESMSMMVGQSPSQSSSNTIVYIRDDKEHKKQAGIQQIYLDGKPIFIEKSIETPSSSDTSFTLERDSQVTRRGRSKQSRPVIKIPYILAAAATSSSCSPQIKQQSLSGESRHNENDDGDNNQDTTSEESATRVNDCKKRSKLIRISPSNSIYNSYNYADYSSFKSSTPAATSFDHQMTKTIDKEYEYVELVSMIKSKNDKLVFNPLTEKSF